MSIGIVSLSFNLSIEYVYSDLDWTEVDCY